MLENGRFSFFDPAATAKFVIDALSASESISTLHKKATSIEGVDLHIFSKPSKPVQLLFQRQPTTVEGKDFQRLLYHLPSKPAFRQ